MRFVGERHRSESTPPKNLLVKIVRSEFRGKLVSALRLAFEISRSGLKLEQNAPGLAPHTSPE